MDDEPNGESPASPADIHITPHSEKSLNHIRNKAEMKEFSPRLPSEIEQEVLAKPKANAKSGDSDSKKPPKKRRRLPDENQTNLDLFVVQQAELDCKRAKRKDSAQPPPASSPSLDEDANNGGGCTRIVRSHRTSLGTLELTPSIPENRKSVVLPLLPSEVGDVPDSSLSRRSPGHSTSPAAPISSIVNPNPPTGLSGMKKLAEAEKKKLEETKKKDYVVEKLQDWGLETVKRHLQFLIKWADDEDGTPYPDP